MSARETIAGSPDVRRTNLAVLLRHLHLDGPMRRAELTERLGLTRSTVAGLVGELGRLGVVEQGAAGPQAVPAGRGRPSPVVRPCPLGRPGRSRPRSASTRSRSPSSGWAARSCAATAGRWPTAPPRPPPT